MFFVASSIISLAIRQYTASVIAPTIHPNTFKIALTVFLTLSFLHTVSLWFARHRHARQLSAVSLTQSLASSYFYFTEYVGLAPEIISVYGQRVSLNRHIYWMVSISLLFIIGNSLQGRHGDLGLSRVPRQVAHIALMLVTGFIWQLHSNIAFQVVNFGISMYSWGALLWSMRANMWYACKKYKANPELSSPFEFIKPFALLNWIAYPLVNFLGFAGILSAVNEEAGYAIADLFAKMISASIIQSGLLHVEHIKEAQAISKAMMRQMTSSSNPSGSDDTFSSFSSHGSADSLSALASSLGYASRDARRDASCSGNRKSREHRSKVSFNSVATTLTLGTHIE
jgi:hypothetical protein